jgi:hypothetical protein
MGRRPIYGTAMTAAERQRRCRARRRAERPAHNPTPTLADWAGWLGPIELPRPDELRADVPNSAEDA